MARGPGTMASGAASLSRTVALPVAGIGLLLAQVLTSGLLHAAALLLSAVVVWWRSPRASVAAGQPHEVVTWTAFGLATRIVAAGLAGEGVVAVIGATTVPSLPPGVVVMVLALGTSWFAYQALIQWNRYRIHIADPGDWMNGVGAVLVILSAGLLVIGWTGASIGRWDAPGPELWLTQLGLLVVVGGSGLSVAPLAGLVRDWRIWLICGTALIALGVVLAAGIVGGSGPAVIAVEASWTAVALAIATAAAARPVAPAPRQITSGASAAGALTVLCCGVVVLVVAGLADGRAPTATLFVAAVAVLACAVRLLFVYREVTELAAAREAARTDPLTGLVNRRGLTAALREAASRDVERSLLIVDLDRFKEVNDRHGHALGDEVLRVMSLRMQARVPDGGLLARLGGDEFAVLLSGPGTAEAGRTAEALSAIAAEPMIIAGQPVRLSASIGACTAPAAVTDGEMLRRADTAMYVAKRAGGGVSTYDDVADRRSREEQDLLEELRGALDPAIGGEQITVHLQPQVDLATGRTIGAEALVRWNHPRLGLLAPAAFLDLAEHYGLVGQLTTRVLDQAAATAARWRDRGHDLTVSVNLATSCLVNPDLVMNIDRCLRRHGLSPQAMVLEITETSLMEDPELSLRVAHELVGRGYAISIDDYGTGYSSLSYLNDLPAVELKLDRSFVARICADPRTQAIVAGTIDLAHHLGLRVTAEGVEDESTLDRLGALDCDTSQGYLHARPVPAEEFLDWLDATRPALTALAEA